LKPYLRGATRNRSATISRTNRLLRDEEGANPILLRRIAMACALTRFGLLCRELRNLQNRSMGDQAKALECDIYYISGIETGKIVPPNEYIEKFGRWLSLNNTQYESLRKRRKTNIIDLRQRFSTSNQSNSMRLFRKVSKMAPSQIRDFRTKMQGEAENDRRLSGPVEVS
jgi:transcriptional regulator with XRE-family HTH domain